MPQVPAAKTPEEKTDDFKCLVCLEAFGDGNDFYPLWNCEHVCHTECLKVYLKYEIEMGKCPLICPAEKCKKELTDNDLGNLLDRELRDKYQKFVLNFALEQQEDISWCPNVQCNYAFVIGDKGEGIFRCPQCSLQFCFDCRAPYHRGQSCKEF